MKIEYRDFGLYVIDLDYLKHLHDDIDEEVRFDENKAYDRKPFLGIIVVIDKYTVIENHPEGEPALCARGSAYG